MELTKKEVEHVAHLARMRISEKENELFSKQLSSILEYVKQLQEVDVSGVAETSQVAGLVNVMREDVAEECPKEIRDRIMHNAPDEEDDLFKTRSVFE